VLDDNLCSRTVAATDGRGLMGKPDDHRRADNGGGHTATVREPEPSESSVASALCLSHVTESPPAP
jgi:hypothetical protein